MVSSVLAVAGCGPIFARGGDVPYVQTPAPVVEAMLALADVGLDDVVYDLGAGDGRIVIAAARWRGARGVGIEIDPDLVRQARLAANPPATSPRPAPVAAVPVPPARAPPRAAASPQLPQRTPRPARAAQTRGRYPQGAESFPAPD